jgi:hypothetical protein
VRTRYSGITDIGDESLSAAVVIGESIGTNANGNFWHLRTGFGRKDGDRVLGAVGSNDELGFVAHNDPGDTGQLRHRKQVLSGGGVEHFDGAVSRVRYINMSTLGMDGRVVEASGTLVFREKDISGQL